MTTPKRRLVYRNFFDFFYLMKIIKDFVEKFVKEKKMFFDWLY